MVHFLETIALKHAVQVTVLMIFEAGVFLEQVRRTISAIRYDLSAVLEGLSGAMMVLCLPDFV
jgi:hypothetical protein